MADALILPPRPDLSRGDIMERCRLAGYGEQMGLAFLFGDRGFRVENQINAYDDAIFLVTPNRIVGFNANTDPSRHGVGKASLLPGLWPYKLGTHGLNKPADEQYEALVQAGDVVVSREDMIDWPKGYHEGYGYHLGRGEFRGQFGINHHKGGITITSSEGCQTIPPTQWGDYIAKVKGAMEFYKMSKIQYLLVE